MAEERTDPRYIASGDCSMHKDHSFESCAVGSISGISCRELHVEESAPREGPRRGFSYVEPL